MNLLCKLGLHTDIVEVKYASIGTICSEIWVEYDVRDILRRINGQWSIDFNVIENQFKIVTDTVCLSCGKVKYDIKKVKEKYLREILKKKKSKEEFEVKMEKAKRLYDEKNKSKTCG